MSTQLPEEHFSVTLLVQSISKSLIMSYNVCPFYSTSRLGTKPEATKAFERAVAAGDRYALIGSYQQNI